MGLGSLALAGLLPRDAAAEDVGRPARNPYNHQNRVAALPKWDGKTSSESTTDSYRMFRGNLTHTYYGSGKLPKQPKLLWKFRMADFTTLKHGKRWTWQGTGWTGQTLKYGDYVFVGSTGGHLHCFEATSGKLVWFLAANRSFKGSPCLFENRIYIPNIDNMLRCVDAATGQIVWQWRSPKDMDSSPRVVDGKLIVGGEDGSVKCFDPRTGEFLWKKGFGVGVGEKLGSGGIESSLAVKDGVAYFGHLDGNVRALGLADQKLRWARKIGGDIDASPAVDGDRLFIGSQQSRSCFHCLDRLTGEVVWTAADIRGGIWSSAAVVGNDVYVGGNSGRMYCLDKQSGKTRWVYNAGAAIWASPSVVDGKVLFGAYDEHFRMVDAATGQLLWQHDIGGRSHSGICAVGGKIWVGSGIGWYYCFG